MIEQLRHAIFKAMTDNLSKLCIVVVYLREKFLQLSGRCYKYHQFIHLYIKIHLIIILLGDLDDTQYCKLQGVSKHDENEGIYDEFLFMTHVHFKLRNLNWLNQNSK